MMPAAQPHLHRHIMLLAACLIGGPASGQEPPGLAQGPEQQGRAALLPAVEPAAVDPAAAPRRRALLVGISEYTKLGGRNGDWPDLPTRSDVEVMKQALVGHYGFAPGQVEVLTEDRAERQKIVDMFRSHLIKDARPGDVVVFYFSGHGQRIPDPKSWGGLRGSLVTADYVDGAAPNGAKTNLRSDTLRELLRDLKARMRKDPNDPNSPVEGNITVLLDACYSGGGTKGVLKPKGRAWDPAKDGPVPEPELGVRSKGAAGFFDKDEAIAQGYVLLAASRSEQPALAPEEGTEVSLMTYHLTQLLAQAPPSTTYRDAFRRLEVALAGHQSPQLEGRYDQRLFAAEERPGEASLPVLKVEGSRVTLPVGRVQGATRGSRFALFPAGKSVKDPMGKVAEVEVDAVRTTTCVAAPTAEYAAVDPKVLEGARAVEALHNYGEHQLRVLFAEADPQDKDKFVRVEPPAGLLRGEGDVLTTEGVTPAAYDVRIRREGGGWVLERLGKEAHEVPGDRAPAGAKTAPPATPAGGLVLTRIKGDGDVVSGLRTALVGEWRYQFLARRLKKIDPEGALNVELRLVPGVVEENDDGEKAFVEHRGWEHNSQVMLRPGDCVAVEVRNKGIEPVYVTVLDLGTDGSVKPVFPPQDAPPIEHFTPARIMPGKDWERLRGQVVQLEKPAGQELIKVIATKQPADFSGFLYIPPNVEAKGPKLKGIPAKFQPLALLIDNVMAGRKGNPVSTAVDWCTAECLIEVQLP